MDGGTDWTTGYGLSNKLHDEPTSYTGRPSWTMGQEKPDGLRRHELHKLHSDSHVGQLPSSLSTSR
jgi:hypothetical protein